MKPTIAASVCVLALLLASCAPEEPVNTPAAAPQNPAIAALLTQSQQAAAGGHPHRAEGLVERALRIQPQNASLWHALATLRLAQHPNEARALATKSNALTSDPNLQAQNWHLIAEAWAASGHPHRAAAADSRAQAAANP